MSITLAQLGLIHEYGTSTIPPRPFLFPAIQNHQREIRNLSAAVLAKVVRGEMSKRDALGKIGALAQGLVQQQIRETTNPPLQPETIRRKGSSQPLIDSGNMIQNVQWEYE
jgi:hypothetical protein